MFLLLDRSVLLHINRISTNRLLQLPTKHSLNLPQSLPRLLLFLPRFHHILLLLSPRALLPQPAQFLIDLSAADLASLTFQVRPANLAEELVGGRCSPWFSWLFVLFPKALGNSCWCNWSQLLMTRASRRWDWQLRGSLN